MAIRKISFDDYINNPSGGAAITNRKMYKDLYSGKFYTVLLREQGKIVYTVYKTKDNQDSYFIHIKVPDEVIPGFYYDNVIRLFTTDNSKKSATSLKTYEVQFFSNDPAFVFTFAYAFNKNGLFINDLKQRMSKLALKNEAKIKNPNNEIFYVKTLYFSYLIMQRYNLFNRAVLDRESIPYSKSKLLKEVTHADEKIKARHDEQVNINSGKKKIKKDSSSAITKHATATVNSIKNTKSVKTTKTVKKIKNTKISSHK